MSARRNPFSEQSVTVWHVHPWKEKRILKVWQFDPAQISAYYNYALCDALSAAGAEVTYFTSPYIYDEVVVPETFTTNHLYFRGLNNRVIRDSPRLRQVLRGAAYPLGHAEAVIRARSARPDVAHLQWSRLPRMDRPFIQAMRRQGAGIVHTVHDVVPLFEQPGYAQTIGEVYALCDALIVHGEANRQELLATFPALDPAHVSVVPHVSLQKLFPQPEEDSAQAARQFLASALALPDNAFVYVLFGNLKAYKGIDLLLEAFAQITHELPHAHLLLVGKLSAGLSIPARSTGQVHLVSGYVPTRDVWKYLLGSDVAVFPYRQITQSGALITAMGFGLPVIVTDVGALPETVDGNGWIVAPTATDLAGAMRDATVRRNELAPMGARSLELIQTRHAPEIVGKKLMDTYSRIGA